MTPAQRRHLAELAARGPFAGWNPKGQQRRSVNALVKEGLLEYAEAGWFVLTEKGRAATHADEGSRE